MKSYLPFWCCYLHQGMITALTLQGVVGYFRHVGSDLQQLSWLWLCMLPWVFKFLWAPWSERHALAWRGRPYLGSLLLLQLAMAALLAAIALFLPDHAILPVLAALLLLTLLSASHDVYADGITICATDARTRPYANMAQVGGSYLGILFGSLVFLWLAEYLGWSAAFAGMAGISLLLLLPLHLLYGKDSQHNTTVSRSAASPARLRLRDLRHLWPSLALAALYYLAMRGLLALQTVLLVDQGLSLAALGQTLFAYSIFASGSGVLLGGWLARHLGAVRCLLPVMAAHTLLAMVLAFAYPSGDLRLWLTLFGLANLAAAVGFVTLYNVLMGQVRSHQPASDYAAFQSADAALGMLTAMLSLQLAGQLGYQVVLAWLALLSLFSLWLVSILLQRLAHSFAPCLPQVQAAAITEDGHG